jgi:hypothetical protein
MEEESGTCVQLVAASLRSGGFFLEVSWEYRIFVNKYVNNVKPRSVRHPDALIIALPIER